MIMCTTWIISYSRGRPSILRAWEPFSAGKGLNQSIALAKAGVAVYQAGLWARTAANFYRVCKENHVDTTYLGQVSGQERPHHHSVDRNAQNCILLYGGSNRRMTKEYIDSVLDHFEAGDILVLQNEINCLDYVIDRAYEKQMTIILNPSPYDSGLDSCDLTKVSVFLINEVEGRQISGYAEPQKILYVMREKFPVSKIVLTLGGDRFCVRRR